MESETQVQILDKAGCILFNINALHKSGNQ